MNALQDGMNVSAKVVEISRDSMCVEYCGKLYHIDFERFPYFRSCFLSELYNVQASAEGLHWPDADIDLEIAYIENPPEESSQVSMEWWKNHRKKLLARLGSAGGSTRSAKKTEACRRNGAKGGRPSKKKTAATA